jgi:hypothetical protein
MVGIVGATKHQARNDGWPPAMYFPVWQWPDNGLYLAIRTKVDRHSLASLFGPRFTRQTAALRSLKFRATDELTPSPIEDSS